MVGVIGTSRSLFSVSVFPQREAFLAIRPELLADATNLRLALAQRLGTHAVICGGSSPRRRESLTSSRLRKPVPATGYFARLAAKWESTRRAPSGGTCRGE